MSRAMADRQTTAEPTEMAGRKAGRKNTTAPRSAAGPFRRGGAEPDRALTAAEWIEAVRPIALTALGLLAIVPIAHLGAPWPLAFGLALLLLGLLAWDNARRGRIAIELVDEWLDRVLNLDARPILVPRDSPLRDALDRWNELWPARVRAIERTHEVVEHARALPRELDAALASIQAAAEGQEEAVEETASLVANMRQSMTRIGQQVELLIDSSEASASQVLEMSSSIEEVAGNTAALHEVVDASTASVHEMGASVRQVARGAEQVQEMAESTATAMIQMDRSVQEVSNHAAEAASLTERAHTGATAGREAVEATITDIERIAALTKDAMERLDGLVARISEIGSILSAIDEINDETNLLSLNAAIIAAQAGEQGKAFLVVANHVKTLARRTAASTQDIEKLITAIEGESTLAVEAMKAGIDAVDTGVERSRKAGSALETILDACRDASERVGEIARSTGEQSRNSKGVADATQQTSRQIQQISEAIAEQKRASEAMLQNAERALSSCLLVHRSTDEQRQTSQHITAAINAIGDMIREIGAQTTLHGRASEAVSEAVMRLLENARAAGKGMAPFRTMVRELEAHVAELEETPVGVASSSPAEAVPLAAPVERPTSPT
jgi:methyl-accepting chemotaxis protein